MKLVELIVRERFSLDRLSEKQIKDLSTKLKKIFSDFELNILEVKE